MKIPVPPEQAYLPYQIRGIQAALKYLKYWKAFAFNDDMGIGKTIQALGVANALQADRILVCCPAHLMKQWRKEIKIWSTSFYPSTLVNSKNQKPGDGHLAISYGALSDKYNKKIDWTTSYQPLDDYDLVVIDEYHAFKDSNARRTKSIFPRLLSNRGRVLLLSGTMPVSKSIDFWPTLRYFFPQIIEGYNYHRFAHQFCRVKTFHKNLYFEGVRNEDILNPMIYGSGGFIKRMIEDVRNDLPPAKLILSLWPKDDYTKFLHIEKPFSRKFLEEGERSLKHLPLERIAPLRRLFSLAKVPRIIEYIYKLKLNGKVLVLAHHRDTIDSICEELAPMKIAKIYGGMTLKQREKELANFLEYDIQILVGNIQSVSVGLNMASCHQILFAEMDWNMEINRQAIARCRRHGQVKQVEVHFTVVEDSLDARILIRGLNKQDDVKKLKGDTSNESIV